MGIARGGSSPLVRIGESSVRGDCDILRLLQGAGLSAGDGAGSAGIRVLGLAAQPVAEPHNKWAGLYRALGRRFDLVGTVLAGLPPAWRWALRARHIRPDRAAWRARAAYDPRAFAAITRALEPRLAAWDGRFELIVQLQTIFEPGDRAAARTFVVYTDWTHALHASHSPLTSAHSVARRRSLEAETARLARHVFTTSELARRSFIEDYGCDPQLVTAVGGGANTIATGARPEPEGPPRALFVGYDFERKGGEIVLKAWSEVRRRVPAAELLIAARRRERRARTVSAGSARSSAASWRSSTDRRPCSFCPRCSSRGASSSTRPWGRVCHASPCVRLRCPRSSMTV